MKHSPRPPVLALLAPLALAACRAEPPAHYAPAELGTMRNATTFGPWIFGGQPSAEDLALLRDQGVTRVVDLRLPGEDRGYDEATTCRDLDLAYESVPYSPRDPDLASVHRILALYDTDPAPGSVLVHCSSANRVALLFAVHRVTEDGVDVETAIADARGAGLKPASEPIVRSMCAEMVH